MKVGMRMAMWLGISNSSSAEERKLSELHCGEAYP
jgi:hypothetical protein